MRVRRIAELLDAPFEGDGDVEIVSGAEVRSAGRGDLAFVDGAGAAAAAEASGAGCLIVPVDLRLNGERTLIRVPRPRNAFAKALKALLPKEPRSPGRSPTSVVDDAATLGEDVHVGAFVVIEADAEIGPRTTLGPGCWIGRGARLGADCRLDAGVRIYPGSILGERCLLQAGAVIGAEGFGFIFEDGRYEKFPQIGRARLGDDCEIGACACVDRGALGETVLGRGVKLDNLVHVGHNCRLGDHVVIAAQTGLAGGVTVEDYVVMGGQVGIADKAAIGRQAVLGAQAGIVSNQVLPAGKTYWGTPARPHREHLKNLARVDGLAKLIEEVRDLRRRLEEAEQGR